MKIVIATDGLPAATGALHEAARVLSIDGAEVIVVSVNDAELHTGGNQDAEDDVARGIEILKAHRIQARGEVLHGHYADAIIARAEELRADVLVVGHERVSRFAQLLAGSVSAEIVRRFHGAVLVVPHERRDD